MPNKMACWQFKRQEDLCYFVPLSVRYSITVGGTLLFVHTCVSLHYLLCRWVDECYITCVDLYEWCQPDKETSDSGYSMILLKAAMCAPWVAWIGGNAVVHFFWVGALLGCQIYQVGNRW